MLQNSTKQSRKKNPGECRSLWLHTASSMKVVASVLISSNAKEEWKNEKTITEIPWDTKTEKVEKLKTTLRFQPKLEPMIGRLSPSWYHTRRPVAALRQKIVAYVEVGAEPNWITLQHIIKKIFIQMQSTWDYIRLLLLACHLWKSFPTLLQQHSSWAKIKLITQVLAAQNRISPVPSSAAKQTPWVQTNPFGSTSFESTSFDLRNWSLPSNLKAKFPHIHLESC